MICPKNWSTLYYPGEGRRRVHCDDLRPFPSLSILHGWRDIYFVLCNHALMMPMTGRRPDCISNIFLVLARCCRSAFACRLQIVILPMIKEEWEVQWQRSDRIQLICRYHFLPHSFCAPPCLFLTLVYQHCLFSSN